MNVGLYNIYIYMLQFLIAMIQLPQYGARQCLVSGTVIFFKGGMESYIYS